MARGPLYECTDRNDTDSPASRITSVTCELLRLWKSAKPLHGKSLSIKTGAADTARRANPKMQRYASAPKSGFLVRR
jgi:hypothetical protein